MFRLETPPPDELQLIAAQFARLCEQFRRFVFQTGLCVGIGEQHSIAAVVRLHTQRARKRVGCFHDLTQREAKHAEAYEIVAIVRRQVAGFLEQRDGLPRAPQTQLQIAIAEAVERIGRRQLQERTKFLPGLLVPPHRGQRVGILEMIVGPRRLHFHRDAILLQRLHIHAEPPVQVAQTKTRIGEIRVTLDRAPILGHGLLDHVLDHIGVAEASAEDRVVLVHLDRALVFRKCPLHLARADIVVAQPHPQIGGAGVDRHILVAALLVLFPHFPAVPSRPLPLEGIPYVQYNVVR